MSIIRYIKGDLFSHVPSSQNASSILAHACNCQGVWGGGIAAVFKLKYPDAYVKYREYCLKRDTAQLLGTSYLIPTNSLEPGNRARSTPIYIACLFTSNFSESPAEIVEYTQKAMIDLLHKIKLLEGNGETIEFEKSDSGSTVVNLPKINAGIFAVPWEDTEEVLQQVENVEFNVYVV